MVDGAPPQHSAFEWTKEEKEENNKIELETLMK